MESRLAICSVVLTALATGSAYAAATRKSASQPLSNFATSESQRTGGRSQEQPPQVVKLLATVRDVAKLVAARKAGRQELFFALPIRNGDIAAAVEAVRKQKLQIQAVAALLDVIKETKASTEIDGQTTCANAVRALAVLGPDATTALPTLKELTAHPDPFVQSEVSQALKLIEKGPGQA